MDTEQTLEEAFPNIDPGLKPLGSRVLVQIRMPRSKTKSGIILQRETQETEQWNTQVAKVLDVGALAFRNRNTMELWPEGEWCAVGDFVRVPKYGGDRWQVDQHDENGKKLEESALFVIFNDHDLVGKVTVNPLFVKSFI